MLFSLFVCKRFKKNIYLRVVEALLLYHTPFFSAKQDEFNNTTFNFLILKKKHLRCSENLHRNAGKFGLVLLQEKVATQKLAPAILDTVGKPRSCSVQWN